MNLWELTNTVVNYEVDKHLNELQYTHCGNSFMQNKVIAINNHNIDIQIIIGINKDDDKNECRMKIYRVDIISKLISPPKYFNKDITLDEFKKLGDELIADFIDKLRR